MMNSTLFSITLKVIKFILIVLLLGLGVHFGLIAPRGDSGLDHAGIFGSSYRLVVAATIALYFLYRAAIITAKVSSLNQQEIKDKKVSIGPYQDSELNKISSDEIGLFIFVMAPIAVGTALTHSTIDLESSTFFQVLRFIMVLVIFNSVRMLYNEKVEFSKASESDGEQPA